MEQRHTEIDFKVDTQLCGHNLLFQAKTLRIAMNAPIESKSGMVRG